MHKNQVVPSLETNLEKEETEWVNQFTYCAHIILKENIIPKKYNSLNRITGNTCIPIYCAPCCLWSTIWRCICCPYQICVRGFPYMCSDNDCTTCTDMCIDQYHQELNATFRISIKEPNIIKDKENQEKLNKVLSDLLKFFNVSNYSKIHYQASEILFGTLPYQARDKIANFQKLTSL